MNKLNDSIVTNQMYTVIIFISYVTAYFVF